MKAPRPRLILALILSLYLALGVLFAVNTPPWQAPDEPAHYNYVRYLAEKGSFPVLHMGDYPHTYLEEIKSRRFPPDLSIDPIRYEFHQPPLYYALAAPIYNLTGGDPFALRIFSVILGGGIVLLAYAIARRALPAHPGLALGAAAFVAFLPQHLATVSQIGNDVLAELLFAVVLFVLVGWLAQPKNSKAQDVKRKGLSKDPIEHPVLAEGYGLSEEPAILRQAQDDRPEGLRTGFKVMSSVWLGILLGLILITKTTAYVALPLAGGVLIWRWRRERSGLRRILMEGLVVAMPAALIALPWYARDVAVYGWPDFLGLSRHDQIVVGQLRTADFVAQQGWHAYWLRAARDTFRSFWGQFGWMGVVLDTRVYFALLLLSGVVLGGLVLRVVSGRRRHASPAIMLLGIAILLTLLIYAWYNTRFLQHQGRYLFTALIPIAIFFSLGWEGVLRPAAGRILATALAIFGFGLAAWGVLAGSGLPKWPLAITAAFAAGLLILDFGLRSTKGGAIISESESHDTPSTAPETPDAGLYCLAFALPFVALPLLDLYALYGGIVPQLTR